MPSPDHPQIITVASVTQAEIPLPVEPLWDLESAAILLLVRVPYLKKLLRKHEQSIGPRIYQGSFGRRRRLLRASDIQYLRSVLVGPHWRAPRKGTSVPEKTSS